MSEKIKVGFIGAGNMGSAIIRGIAKSSLAENIELYAYNPSIEKVNALSDCKVKALLSEKEVVKKCKYVFLAIKPQKFDAVLPLIKDAVTEETVFISIAAGITSSYIQEQTKQYAKVILAMPNTPLLLGEGATALAYESPVTAEEFSIVKQIFDSCGITAEVTPEQMKSVIAINGSSPAFIYLFAKGFFDYAKSIGISEESATVLFSKTLIGSAKMITDSGYSIEELIKQVSSPGGTTLAGLDAFYKADFTDIIQNACEKCTNRAYELSK